MDALPATASPPEYSEPLRAAAAPAQIRLRKTPAPLLHELPPAPLHSPPNAESTAQPAASAIPADSKARRCSPSHSPVCSRLPEPAAGAPQLPSQPARPRLLQFPSAQKSQTAPQRHQPLPPLPYPEPASCRWVRTTEPLWAGPQNRPATQTTPLAPAHPDSDPPDETQHAWPLQQTDCANDPAIDPDTQRPRTHQKTQMLRS